MIDLQKVVDDALEAALKKFAVGGLTSDQLAVSLVDLTDPQKLVRAEFRGDAPAYPASVIKLFYMVAAHQQMADGTIQDNPELRRAMRDMIVDSGNEPTGYILDVLSDTTSGPDLPPAELAAWHEKRNVVNRYFHSHGYPEVNANRKTWHEGPYGRDRQAVEQFTPSRNSLTANVTCRLLVEIFFRRCVSPEHSEQMLEIMRRDVTGLVPADYQAREFIGSVVPKTTKIWSKAGYMSKARHDAAIIELANGKKLALVIFTERCSEERDLIPEIARHIVGPFVEG
jgi:hypothetical protein